MRRRLLLAAALVALVALAAVTAASAPAKSQADSITVWLMNDAQTSWPGAVTAANRQFLQQHPGVDVNVVYQSWGEHGTKFDASLAGGNAPDVKELGNTETVKYMAAGALADITAQKGSFPNSRTWLQGLAESVTYNGKLYGVPYYAGARAVIYRVDQYRQAGIPTRAPKTLDQFVANGRKLMQKFGKDRGYSALYFPGKYWYASMSFVYDYGGRIARFRNNRWQGALNSPQAIEGLTKLKSVVLELSRANKTGDEANPAQASVFSKGKVGSFIGNGWEWGDAVNPKVGNPELVGKIGAYPMPSHIAGRYMPTFLGGSDLVIPATSKQKALAADWIKAFTDTASMTQIAQAGVIPNTTSLAKINAAKPTLAPFARAASYSWFVPAAKNWVNVESANVLQNMLVSIFTGRSSIKAAADRASNQITQILNESR
jgi:N,N'-diacetylchitobiose transport system substrate-binding protein